MINEIIIKYWFIIGFIFSIIWIIGNFIYFFKNWKKDCDTLDYVLGLFGGTIGIFTFAPILLFLVITLGIIIWIPYLTIEYFKPK